MKESNVMNLDWRQTDAVIFDMDGTLVDSMQYWIALPVEWFESRGLAVPGDLAAQLGMMHLRQAATYFVQQYSPQEDSEDTYQELLTRMDKHYAEDIPLLSGVREFLAALRAAGKRTCIATMTDRSQVEIMLRTHGLGEYFDFITTTPEVGKGKDCPDIYLQAAEKFGLPPERVAVFEDSRVAAATALAAGFGVVVMRKEGMDYSALAGMGRSLSFIDDFCNLAVTE